MSKFIPAAVLALIPNKIATATRMTACSAQPAVFADIATYMLGSVAVAPGDFTVGADAGTGQQVAVAQKTGGAITTGGTATHVAFDDGADPLFVTICTAQVLTVGNPLTFQSISLDLSQPT